MTASSEVPRHGSTSMIDTALVQVSTPSHHHILTPSLCTPHTMCRLYCRFIPHISHILTVTPSSSSSTSTHYMRNAGSINMYIYIYLSLPLSPSPIQPCPSPPLHFPPCLCTHLLSSPIAPLSPHTGYTRRLYGGHLTVPTAPPKVGYHGDEGYRRNTPELRSQRSVFDYEGNNHVTEYTVT